MTRPIIGHDEFSGPIYGEPETAKVLELAASIKLEAGHYYKNGLGDVHGPMEERAKGVWLDESGILYHPDGRQWDHAFMSAGNLVNLVDKP